MRKIEYSEVYNLFKSKGYELLDKVYKNNNTKMTCVNLEGYKLFTSYDNLRSGKNSKIFHVSNPYTIENMKLYLKNNNYKIELLTDKYEKAKSKMLFRCTIHNKEFYMSWDGFMSGCTCPLCSKTKKNNYDDVYNYFKRKGLTIIEGEYVNRRSNMTCIDENGYKFTTTYDRLKNGRYPRMVDITNPYSIYNINLYTNYNKNNVDLISGQEYKSAKSKLKFKCLIHDCIFEINWNNFSQGKGCPTCGIEANHSEGGYNFVLAERHKVEYLTTPMNLYIIKCSNEFEEFYKIGLTKNNIETRFNCKKAMPYSYEELYFVSGDKYNFIYLEKELHKLNENYSYMPKIYFEGYTECFSDLNFDEIEEIINKYKIKITI